MSSGPPNTRTRLLAIERYITRDLPPLMCWEKTHGDSGTEECGRGAEFVCDTGLGYMPLCRRCLRYYTGESWTLSAADRIAFALADAETNGGAS